MTCWHAPQNRFSRLRVLTFSKAQGAMIRPYRDKKSFFAKGDKCYNGGKKVLISPKL
jgi:hypothetical protein